MTTQTKKIHPFEVSNDESQYKFISQTTKQNYNKWSKSIKKNQLNITHTNT